MTGKIKKIISIENGDNYVADIEDIENRITQNSSNLETAKQELSNKCNEALNEAKAYTDQEKAKYLPLTGIADHAKLADKAIADKNNNDITTTYATKTENTSNLASAKAYADTKKNEALGEAKAYTNQEKAKYIPLTGSDQLSDGTFITTKQSPESRLTIGCLRGTTGKNYWRTGGLVVLSPGASNRKGACQFFASRKINEGSDDDVANFLTTTFTVRPEGTIEKAITKAGTTDISFVETQRIINGPNQTCILYENGWCLQCGRVWAPENSDFATVNLLTPFRDTGYVVFCMGRDPDDNLWPAVASTNFNSKTTTSFHAVLSYPSNRQLMWIKGDKAWGIDWLALGFVN